MRAVLLLASLMLVSAEPEPPRSYSSFSSQPSGVSFQNVPTVAAFSGGGSSSSRYPSSSYGNPSSSSQQSYSAPVQAYGSPGSSSGGGQQSQSYSAPSYPSSSYGSPSAYQGQSSPANVQVSYGSVPPQLPPGSSYGPPPVVTNGQDHDVEYRVVYKPVKAPKPDLILPPPPPRQKTIVYILVPRIEPPEPIIVPTHAPTAPSKPEVYFIRYKAPKRNKAGNGGSSYGVPSPSTQYGIESAPKPVVVDAPKKREVVRVSSSSSEHISSSEADPSEFVFGERVKSFD